MDPTNKILVQKKECVLVDQQFGDTNIIKNHILDKCHNLLALSPRAATAGILSKLVWSANSDKGFRIAPTAALLAAANASSFPDVCLKLRAMF